MSALLRVEHLVAGYGDVVIVHDASLEVERGELVTIMLGERLPQNQETCHKVAESVPLISLTPKG